MSTTDTPTRFTHPAIGDLKGKTTDGIVQFLGLKYASLRDRFAPAEPMKYDPEIEIDATTIGPTTISLPAGLEIEQSLIQASLPKPPNFRMSDTDCLNLNISLPEELTMTTRASTEPLPVFVLVHGGGFNLGANSYPQWDLARLVRRSVEAGMPVVGVGINYRLGAPGFLTSEELRAAGYQTNNGLQDQAMALKWVRQYISGFGGDAENITFVGQSAGAVSGHYHLSSQTPLFKRLALFGGTQLLLPALPPQVSDHAYAATLNALGLTDRSVKERVEALVNLPAEELLSKLGPDIPFSPVVDGDIIPARATFEDITVGKSDWCRDLFIGDCADDGLIFAFLLGPRATSSTLAAEFCESAADTLSSFKLPPEIISRFLGVYRLDPSLDSKTALVRILTFVSEVCFHAPTVAMARRWSTKGDGWSSYVWRFNEPNPWPGQWQGHVTHILDLAYLCLNYEEAMSKAQRKVGQALADDLIKFVNGLPPWESLRGASTETSRVYGPSGEGVPCKLVPQLVGSKARRTDTLYRLSEGDEAISLDQLSAVWGKFLAGG